jgi:5'-nucleotidase
LKILLTNDDGIEAEGLQCLYEVLRKKAECFVVAPDQGRSCCSHGVTTHTSLEVAAKKRNQWTVSGTPADCVRVGLLWLELKPDLVVSGVNHGGNLGVDILYSGTAAGAREASLLGVPAVAISQYMRRDIERDWDQSAKRADLVLENILKRETPGAGYWNVNLPALPKQLAAMDFPISVCDPELQAMAFSFEEASDFAGKGLESLENADPRLVRTVSYQGNYQARPRAIGSDVDLCFGGHATVSWLDSVKVGVRI